MGFCVFVPPAPALFWVGALAGIVAKTLPGIPAVPASVFHPFRAA